jgi:hypothetical protein
MDSTTKRKLEDGIKKKERGKRGLTNMPTLNPSTQLFT